MKSYEQMARSVLSRRDQILKREQLKRTRYLKYAARISTACGALALSVGAAAVWYNIKDTQKDPDEFVRPTESTTQTTVALQSSDDDNNNNSSADGVIQDSTEAVTTAVTKKVVVTSVSKNKEGKNVIVTTEVAVPATTNKVTRPVIIGPSPIPTAKTTSKHTTVPKPAPTTVATTPARTKPTETRRTTAAPQPTAPAPTTSATHATTVPPHTEPPQTAPQPTNAPQPATEHQQDNNNPAPVNTDPPFNMYRTFELNGRYYNFMYDTYYGETSGMTMYYSGPVTFYDWNNQPVSEEVSIYAIPGEYKVIMNLKSQGRYIWYNISYPF